MTVPAPQMLRGHTWHGRKGAQRNAFRYGVDYVLIDAEDTESPTPLFARNARAFAAVHDKDHGGPPGRGRGAAWIRDVLKARGLPDPHRIRLLTQPRILGHVFNPVSFWLCDGTDGTPWCIIAEVTNTFGDRHAYLCRHDNLGPITRDRDLQAAKLMHVSPFQPTEGTYRFRFDISGDRIGIRIDYDRDGGGVVATLTGALIPMTTRALLTAFLRRPFGSLRVLALIHWQALKLKLGGARYRSRPPAPAQDVSG